MNYKANIEKYEIRNEEGTLILSCFLCPEDLDGMAQIHLETESEVYDGPIAYLFK